MKNLNDYLDYVQETIAHDFDNLDLLRQAFTRSSYSVEHGGENNEILEFIGDRILDYYVTKIMVEEYGYVKSDLKFFNPDKGDEFCIKAHRREKDFTVLKQEIVSNKTLAKRIERFGFQSMLWLGKSDISNRVYEQEKVKADLFEAILGAIAIDSNWDPNVLERSVAAMLDIDRYLNTIDDGIERPEDCSLENAINTLKELAEHGQCSIPDYYPQDYPQYDYDGNPRWHCTCYVRSWGIEKTAIAPSKREAKRYAAYLVLCDRFDLDNEYEDDDD